MDRFDIGLVGTIACKESHDVSSCHPPIARRPYGATFDDPLFGECAAH